MRNPYNILNLHPEGKRPFGRPTSRYKDNVKLDLKRTRYERVDLIDFQDRIEWQAPVNTAMNLRIPKKGMELDQLSDYKLIKKDFALWSGLIIQV
jgi:hypothetical protein